MNRPTKASRRKVEDAGSWLFVCAVVAPAALVAALLWPLNPCMHRGPVARRFSRIYGDPISMLISAFVDVDLRLMTRIWGFAVWGLMLVVLVLFPVALDLAHEPNGLWFTGGAVFWLAAIQTPLRRRDSCSTTPAFPWTSWYVVFVAGAVVIAACLATDVLRHDTWPTDVVLGIASSAMANVVGTFWALIAAWSEHAAESR